MNKQAIIKYIQDNEGLMLKPYKCSSGKLTIGYGRNLDDVGISKSEACMLLSNDLCRAIAQVQNKIPFFEELSDNRQMVLIDLCFNLGINGLLGFKNMLTALESGNYQKAAIELMNSRYATQVGIRAEKNRDYLLNG